MTVTIILSVVELLVVAFWLGWIRGEADGECRACERILRETQEAIEQKYGQDWTSDAKGGA